MDKKRIGIINNYNSAWIAGKYYLDSICEVLNENGMYEVICIPKLSIPYRFVLKIFGDESKILNRINIRNSNKINLDYIYPCERYRTFAKNNVYWIPDFQENYYPQFFSISEICIRAKEQIKIAYSNDILVVSSQSAKKDLERLYPKCSCKVHVLSFITSLYGKKINVNENILKEYNIDRPFFICSNQFWKHKNHKVVINAVKEIKKTNKDILVLFTGKEEDYRNPNYAKELKQYVISNNLEENIKFLGFISRNDQINLMLKSVAIIQPSYFEGWNTTIEDGKYLKKRIIASNLPVHHEQLGEKGFYFDCDDSKKLSALILQTLNLESQEVDYNYDSQVSLYKQTILDIFK